MLISMWGNIFLHFKSWMFCYKNLLSKSTHPFASQMDRGSFKFTRCFRDKACNNRMLTSFKRNVLEINHVTIGCFHLLSKETGWIIRSRVYADVEKLVNTETEVKVVYKRTLQPVSTLLVRNKFYMPKPCFCVCR